MQTVHKLRRQALPNYKDVDQVTQWMDRLGDTAKVSRGYDLTEFPAIQMVQRLDRWKS